MPVTPPLKRLVAAGEIVVEIMAAEVGQSFLKPGPLIGPFPSGAPAIFIDQAGRLGQPAGLVSSVGADDFGRLNLDRLAASGVDVSAVAVHEGAATGSAFVRYASDGSRSFVFNIPNSACGLIALDDAARRLFAEADHIHVMGSSLFSPGVVAVVKAGVEAVKGRGGTVSFDPNIRREMLGAGGMREALDWTLSRCDLFLPSGPELFLFTDETGEEAAVADLLSRGIAAVVVKKGVEGAVHHDASGRIAVPAYLVEEVDPTGAGDCFGAAFVTAWLRGLEPLAALRLAAACGALAVTRKGPMSGTPFLSQAEAFIADRDSEIAP